MLLWSLLSCTWLDTPLEVQGVEPIRVLEGEGFTVTGSGFEVPLSVQLHHADTTSVPGFEVRSTTEIAIHPGVPVGTWEVVVQRGDQVARTAVEVAAKPPETPCERPYEANTELSLQTGEATVVRFHPDGRTERERIPIRDIEAVVYSSTHRDDGSRCSAIQMLRTDGSTVLFEDATSSLEARARTLGDFLERPVRGLPER